MKTIPVAALACVVGLLSGCATTSSVEKARAELLAADQAFNDDAQVRGIFVAFDTRVSDHARLLGTVELGHAGVAMEFKNTPPGTTLTWAPKFADASAAGDLGYTWGDYTYTAPPKKPGDKPRVQKGSYCTVWRRDASGTWKIVEDGGN